MVRRHDAGLRHTVDQGGEASRQGSALVGTQDAERGKGGGGVGRGQRGREDVGAGPVDEEVDDITAGGDETAKRAEGF